MKSVLLTSLWHFVRAVQAKTDPDYIITKSEQPSLIHVTAAAVTSVVSNSGQPHRRQPTRLPRPWDSPGKNTGVGCHFLLQCMKVKRKVKLLSHVRLLATPMECSPPGFSAHGIFQARVLEWGAIAFSSYPFYLTFNTNQISFMRHNYYSHLLR